MTTVFNLGIGEEAVYDFPPRDAVATAFAQLTMKDMNWWSYGEKYRSQVVEGKYTFSCGD